MPYFRKMPSSRRALHDSVSAPHRAVMDSPGLKSKFVDAQADDSCVSRLARNSQLAGCPGWAGDSALALRQRRFDHFFLTLDERRVQRNDGTGYRRGFWLQPSLIN